MLVTPILTYHKPPLKTLSKSKRHTVAPTILTQSLLVISSVAVFGYVFIGRAVVGGVVDEWACVCGEVVLLMFGLEAVEIDMEAVDVAAVGVV